MLTKVIVRFFLVILSFIFILKHNVYAKSPLLIANFNSWSAFSGEFNKKKICYIIGDMKSTIGTINNRAHSYITVTIFDDKNTEFSVSSGYVYGLDQVKIIFDKKAEFQLYTKGKLAWPKTEEEDQKILNLMIKSKILEVIGKNLKNVETKDTYFLNGFSRAYKKIKDQCQ